MKRTKSLLLISLFFSFVSTVTGQVQSQETNTTIYKAEAFGSAATNSTTPFWLVSNRYGKVPLESGNGYLNAGVFHNQRLNKDFYWNAGADIVAAFPRYRNVFAQQLYAEIGWRGLLLSIGSKENQSVSLWNRQLSSGDLVLSPNARPIPEINLSIPDYVTIPFTNKWMYVKGDFAVGRSFDTKYLENFVAHPNHMYVKDVLWHHKSLHLKIEDGQNYFPFSMEFGVQHWAQWGGEWNDPVQGKQPKSLKDFVRIVVGKEGGADATGSDQINVLGNHYGSYDMRLNYEHDLGAIRIYYQHFFEDKSGMEFFNGWDGLWGIELETDELGWLNKLVFEIVDTRNQSGPFHYIDFDHDKYPGRGGGADNYYNNGEYTTGVSYFNRALGSPLVTSPEYNDDGTLGFKNNRIKDYHFGAQGDINHLLSYRFLFTVMNGWGQHANPFLHKTAGTSTLAEMTYNHPKLKGWDFTGAISFDTGNFHDNGVGFGLTVAKRGVIKRW